MFKKISSIFIFIFTIISLSCAESRNGYKLSPDLSEQAFYSTADQIINQFEKNSENCQKNYILAKAYKEKKDLKKSLLYYLNSCFDKKYNFNVRLFPQPVYSFVESSRGRSIFYNDSIYEIASIFFDFGEHEYVLKFIDLVDSDNSALFRDSVLLKSKSLQKLSRYKQSIDDLKKILSVFQDSDSAALINLRLGSIYESAGDFQNAVESYINVIKSESGVWQNSVAAKRLVYITENKNIKIESPDKSILFASALYDAGDYDRALSITDATQKKEKLPLAEKIRLKILTAKNSSKAVTLLKENEGKPYYDEMLLDHANILWDKGNKYASLKSYDKLSTSTDKKITERVLTRLSFFYEERNRPEFIKYMELYIKQFPDEIQSGRFVWLIGRYYMKTGNKAKAIEYFNRGIKNYSDNIYTSYCRFWLNKISPVPESDKNGDEFLEDLAVNNPDSYHTLALLKIKADKTETSQLLKNYEEALKNKNKKRTILMHSLLFIKNGYNSSNTERIKQLDSSFTEQYSKLGGIIENPEYSGDYKSLLKQIEKYFYAGDINSINREIKLIPEEDNDAQKHLAIALTHYSIKHNFYNYASFYSARLLSIYKLKENLSLIPENFARALYPFAFSECVISESKRFNIKPELLLSMMKVESNFNTSAISPAGAAGLMQLMPPTAKGISKELKINRYDLLDPCTSITFGANYISWLDRYYKGQIEYMVSGYNAGAGNVDKWKAREKNRDIDYFSEFTPFDETRDYIFRTKKYFIQYVSIYKKYPE